MRGMTYEQVAADLLRQIEDGTWASGAMLPTRRELRELYGVSDTVIDRAMVVLRMRGAVETVHGVGVRVAAR